MKKAILAGLNVNVKVNEFNDLLKETSNLCVACNIEVVDIITQSSRSIDKKTLFRSGKLQELARMVNELEVDFVVIHNDLTISQLDNIQLACGVEVIDRTTLILDIFSTRAKTKEAMIQTEMARLKYNLPKLLKTEEVSDKQKGGAFNNRGSGETRLEVVRRKTRNKISDLEKELKALKIQNAVQKRKRQDSALKKVALVGYTNAGKSSLMNAILELNDAGADKMVMQKDMLFATLDTSCRNVKLINSNCLLFDTVGFVSHLPHDLIEAFKSTLEACKEADLLVHVMDISNELVGIQKEVTLNTLKEIGANDIPIIDVYNKIDLKNDSTVNGISCVTKEGIDDLLMLIEDRLYPKNVEFTIKIPFNELGILSKYKESYIFEKELDLDDGVVFKVKGNDIGIFSRFLYD